MTVIERVAIALQDLGPIVDPDLWTIRSECPSCWAGSTDPLGLWRPLVARFRDGHALISCDACRGGIDV